MLTITGWEHSKRKGVGKSSRWDLLSAGDMRGIPGETSQRQILPVAQAARGFPCGTNGKEYTYKIGDTGSISGLGRSPGEANDNLLQYSCLGNLMDRGVW